MLNWNNVADDTTTLRITHRVTCDYIGHYHATVDTALRLAVAQPEKCEAVAKFLADLVEGRLSAAGADMLGEPMFVATRDDWAPRLLDACRLMVAEAVESCGIPATF